MDFSLSDDQDQLLRAADRWIDRSWDGDDVTSVDVRQVRWAELQANGWTGLLTPTTSAPMPVLDATLLVERLARGGCTLPVAAGAMVAPLVVAAAGLEPASGIDQLLVVDGDDLATSTGRGLELADRVVVLAATATTTVDASSAAVGDGDGGRCWSVAIVDVGPGSTLVVQDEGPTVLSRLTTPADRVALQPIDRGSGELAWLVGAVLSAAELVGLAQAVLDDCVDYAKARVQGGKPIGGHQAIQHRLADMLGHIERARYQTYLAATTITDEAAAGFDPDRPLPAAHRAKALAGRDCLTAIRSGHQVMGAIAYSAEHGLHHRHKQAVVAAAEFGDAEHHWAALEHGHRVADPSDRR
ncbi:MAG: acyl-CoA dehydrogenase family protein [Acidimicrobiales bacterium]